MQCQRNLRSRYYWLFSFCIVVTNQASLWSQDIDVLSRLVPDALHWDRVNEAQFARFAMSDAGELSDASRQALQRFIDEHDTALVLTDTDGFDASFGCKRYQPAHQLANRLLASSLDSTQLADLLRQSDALMQAGQTKAARAILYRLDNRLQCDLDLQPAKLFRPLNASQQRQQPWYLALQNFQDLDDANWDKLASSIKDAWTKSPPFKQAITEVQLGQLFLRLIYCSILDRDTGRATLEAKLVNRIFGERQVMANPFNLKSDNSLDGNAQTIAQTTQTWLQQLAALEENRKSAASSDSKWTLARYSKAYATLSLETNLQNSDSNPSATSGFIKAAFYQLTQPKKMLCVVQNPNGIFALDLQSAQGWPSGSALNLLLGYIGQPTKRSTVASDEYSISDDLLFVPIGGSQTLSSFGTNDNLSTRMLGLDLKRDASILPDYPLETIDNSPIIEASVSIDSKLIILTSDEIQGGKFSLQRIDQRTGKEIWKSAAFGIANRQTTNASAFNATLAIEQDRIFVATGKSCIAAVDLVSGDIIFETTYAAIAQTKVAYRLAKNNAPQSRLLPYGDLLICAPADCSRIFALGRYSGNLQWVTAADTSLRSNHLLGFSENSLICIGERLQWYSCPDGRLLAAVELPKPASFSYGDAALFAGQIIWSNANGLFQYPASQPNPINSYQRLAIQDLQRWPVIPSGPFAFAINDQFLALATSDDLTVFVCEED